MLTRTLLLTLALTSFAAQAGTWMLSRDEWASNSQLAHSSSDHYWDRQRTLRAANCRSDDWSFNQQVEYGWSYYHTVFADASLLDKQCGAQGDSGLGDLTLGVRSRWDVFRNGRTWEASLILPTGYDAKDPARLGYGQIGIELAAGIRLNSKETTLYGLDYVSAEAGYRHWFGSAAGQLGFTAKASKAIAAQDSVYLNGSLALSMRNGSHESFTPGNQTLLGDYDQLAVTLGWSHRLGLHRSLSLEYGRTLWGRNTGQSDALRLNYHHSWPR